MAIINTSGTGTAYPQSGAYAGHELEKRSQQQTDAYKFTIRMNDGSYQTVTKTTSGDIRVGDRVKIENGIAQRY